MAELPGPSASSERRNVLDRAHRGDIEGALGRVGAHEVRFGPSAKRVMTLLAVMGPGLVVMGADNDAGSLSTYAQAGQDYGLRWLWLPIVLAASLFVLQEMAARLGAVTGAGHARLIFERFGRVWGLFAVGDLIVLNVLTLVTELAGLQFGLGYFGIGRWLAVPVSFAGLFAMSLLGTFRRWERVAMAMVATSLVAIPLLVLVHAHQAPHTAGVVASPSKKSGTGAIFALAMVGTTVAPWQLFFQQSNVVDKRITMRWIGYERADTLIGTVVFAAGAVAAIAATAFAFRNSIFHGQFVNAGAVAADLRARAGPWAGAFFAVALIDGAILCSGVVSLATGYAVGDVSGSRHSLHRKWSHAKVFYGTQTACLTLAAAIVLTATHDLGYITLAVQALSGVLFPSAAVLLLLLCNDRAVLGPWVNRRFHNLLAAALVLTLLVLSGISVARIAFPQLDPWVVAVVLATAGVVGIGAAIRPARASAPGGRRPESRREQRESWSMPPIHDLEPPTPSRARTAALALLRGYIALSALALAVDFVRVVRHS